jgi:photosystem II stability/assembly factor-like uncharacterized protein
MRLQIFLAAALAATTQAYAQWDLQDSHTGATLQSVHAVSERTAWASGADGAILRTNDGGSKWQPCVIPQGAEKLDFPGIQASDENTAVVMSTGKGGLSRIYKTIDGCQTWRLVFTNPDAEGSFKGLRRVTDKQLYLLGDPVEGKFSVFYSPDGGDNWFTTDDPGLEAEKGETTFAVGNGALASVGPFLLFGARGPAGLYLYHTYSKCGPEGQSVGGCPTAWAKTNVPLTRGSSDTLAFSVAARTQLKISDGSVQTILLAVGESWQARALQ